MTDFLREHWFAVLLALFGLGALVWASGLLHRAELPPPRAPKGPREMRHTIIVPPEPPRPDPFPPTDDEPPRAA